MGTLICRLMVESTAATLLGNVVAPRKYTVSLQFIQPITEEDGQARIGVA